jgi:hypothetical protein
MTGRAPDKTTRATAETERAGYGARRTGRNVSITHPVFTRPLMIGVARLNPDRIVAELDAYRRTLGGGHG